MFAGSRGCASFSTRERKDTMDLHELTAGYALDALDPAERERYEAHLGSCERCREELQGFWQVTGSLAHRSGRPAAAGLAARADPRAGARRAAERRPARAAALRRAGRSRRAAAVAAVVGARRSASGRLRVSGDLDDANARARPSSADPDARSYESADGEASLVVAPSGDAAIVVARLEPAPAGKDYEIWVIEDGVPRSAGALRAAPAGGRALPAGRRAARWSPVTVEPDGGVDAPTSDPTSSDRVEASTKSSRPRDGCVPTASVYSIG